MGRPDERKNAPEMSGKKCKKLDNFFSPKTLKIEDEEKEVVNSPEIESKVFIYQIFNS